MDAQRHRDGELWDYTRGGGGREKVTTKSKEMTSITVIFKYNVYIKCNPIFALNFISISVIFASK